MNNYNHTAQATKSLCDMLYIMDGCIFGLDNISNTHMNDLEHAYDRLNNNRTNIFALTNAMLLVADMVLTYNIILPVRSM